MIGFSRLRVALAELPTRIGFPRDWFLIPLSAIIGALAGLVAMGFAWMVSFSERFFFHQIAHHFAATQVAVLLLLPALGGLAVGMIRHYLWRKPAGHGVPDAIEALTRRQGIIKGRDGVFTAVTSSLTIGSGGSAGEEGPIIHIGASLGSKVGQLLRVGPEHMHTLVGCGAAAGLASLFNAPIAGVLFVLEVMLRDFSLRTFMPIVIASVMGTATAQAIHGQNESVFNMPREILEYQFTIGELGGYAVLGVICGLVGYIFIRSLYKVEGLWRRVRLPASLMPALGGIVLGVTGIAFVLLFGRIVPDYEPPPFFGNGYPVIEWLFEPRTYNFSLESNAFNAQWMALFLLITLAFKVVGTSLTLGSGGAGGVFAPSLFMGASLGGLFGLGVRSLGWFGNPTPATYAVAGMAGVLAGTVHCPLTAFLLVFEVTRDYKFIVPVMLVSILATIVAQMMMRDSIYTLALRERGIHMGSFADLTLLRRLKLNRAWLLPAVTVLPQEPAQRLIDLGGGGTVADYVVCDRNNRYKGMVVGQDVRATLLEREALPLLVVAELMRTDLPTIGINDTLELVLDKFSAHDASSLTVVDDGQQVMGVLTRAQLMREYSRALEGD